MTDAHFQGRVTALLERSFPLLRGRGLLPDTPLVSSGLLDSFGVVTLVSDLEAEFAIEIDVEEVALERFETIRGIAALCHEAQTRG